MENKPYKISKEDAIILQRHCEEIKSILEKYAWHNSDALNVVTSMSRIKSAFSTFNEWVNIASYFTEN